MSTFILPTSWQMFLTSYAGMSIQKKILSDTAYVHIISTSSSSQYPQIEHLIHANTEAHLPRLKRQLHDATDDGVARHNNGDGRDDDGWLEDIKGQPNDGRLDDGDWRHNGGDGRHDDGQQGDRRHDVVVAEETAAPPSLPPPRRGRTKALEEAARYQL